MKIGVTGSEGFIGRHLVRWLIEDEHDVFGLDSMVGSIDQVRHPVTLYGTVQGYGLWEGWSADVVVHLAAFASEYWSRFAPARTFEENAALTFEALRQAIAGGAKRFVFVSSCAVYGRSPQEEWSVPDPIDPYGAAKLAAEAMVRGMCDAHGISWTILRMHNVYGPGQVATAEEIRSVVAIWCERVVTGRPIGVVGDGRQIRSWSYVDDLREELLAVVSDRQDRLHRRTFNVGDGITLSVRTLADRFVEVAGLSADSIEFLPARDEAEKVAPSLTVGRYLIPGLEDPTPIERALERTLAWYRRWRERHTLPEFAIPPREI